MSTDCIHDTDEQWANHPDEQWVNTCSYSAESGINSPHEQVTADACEAELRIPMPLNAEFSFRHVALLSREDVEILAQNFVQAIYDFQSSGEIEDGVDYALGKFNEYFAEGHAEVCDAILARCDADRVGPELILALLSITFVQRDALPMRKAFYDYAKSCLEKSRGVDYAQRLVGRLR